MCAWERRWRSWDVGGSWSGPCDAILEQPWRARWVMGEVFLPRAFALSCYVVALQAKRANIKTGASGVGCGA